MTRALRLVRDGYTHPHTFVGDGMHASHADCCLPDLLREQVRSHPDHTAVVCHQNSLTYRELAVASSRVGAYLRRLGVTRDDCVGLFVAPSIDLMVGVWGILFAGGAYLPLSPEYPEERLRYMIEHSRTRVILCQEALKPRLAELAPRHTTVVSLDDAAHPARPVSEAERGFGAGPHPTDLAYVIYTSGSTGQPKGVMIEHRSIVNQMRWMTIAHHLGRSTTVLQKTPMSFDAAQWEILAVACGARVVMGSPGVHRDPERMLRTIAEHDVTTLQCVPTLLQALLYTEDAPHRASSLRQIFSGGEALSRSLALRCAHTLPRCELINLYGPTECTINASAFTVDPTVLDGAADMISIGTPVYGTEFHILTPERSPVAMGDVGELYISGIQLARGYLYRPDLTSDRFVANPFSRNPGHARLYRTGDLASWNADGTVQFVGRTDNQVKLRGHRIELDEIRLAIENHDWIRHAGVIVKDDPASGFQSLIAFIELNPAEAALMDQGNHGAHHQSKESKLQLKAQLSNMGCRTAEEISGKPVIELPGKASTPPQRRRVFARKTYRFFEGGDVTSADILRLLERDTPQPCSRSVDALGLAELGEILRYFGQYFSPERLLPKYAYASPGALYPTQMYLEACGVGGLSAGYYYYHPVHHQLILIRERPDSGTAQVRVHFVGRTAAIKPVYETNVQEVLSIEAGHMVGLFDEVLPHYGLAIEAAGHATLTTSDLQCASEDSYLAAFAIVPYAAPGADDDLDVYVQSHPGRVAGMPAGQYLYEGGTLMLVSDDRVERRHVIAINQQVYDRSSFGITLVSRQRDGSMSYVALGRRLQRLMMNQLNLGFMSSGYSSETGFSLPSAKRIDDILTSCGRGTGASYFFLGGRVSDEQLRSEGMKEDAVHMKGPAEMVKDDLAARLPDYMVPNRVVVLDSLPLTANGKVDGAALAASDEANAEVAGRPFVAPRTKTEEAISEIWRSETKHHAVSVHDDFFEFGGNSLMAVGLVNKVNRTFGSSLPLQVLFDAPTIEQLAEIVDSEHDKECSRLVALNAEGAQSPVFCWPGLGGYTMNLRLLAERVNVDRPVFGVQAYGINEDETPYRTVQEMATEDAKAVRCLQPRGPYTLWGYSFGARVAFETAYLLEQAGERVENLFLIAPGAPKVRARGEPVHGSVGGFDDRAYVTILFSVFAGSIIDPLLSECLEVAKDEESFAEFITRRFPGLDSEMVKRVVRLVARTYPSTREVDALAGRQIQAPVTIFNARGDAQSFVERAGRYAAQPTTAIDLDAGHYGVLKEPGIDELVRVIHHRLRTGAESAAEWSIDAAHPTAA